jgi:uncharacterized membrane protein (UPF0127 family)
MRNYLSLTISIAVLLLSCSTPIPVDSQTKTSLECEQSLSDERGQLLPITAKAMVRDQVIDLEVAQTPEQQMLGLMYRQCLPSNRGMLFSFNPPRYTRFWMKNVVIPLDMVFLYQGKIQAIAADVPPCANDPCPTYGPRTPIDRVIELPGGRAAQLGLEVGDRITIEFLQSAR